MHEVNTLKVYFTIIRFTFQLGRKYTLYSVTKIMNGNDQE